MTPDRRHTWGLIIDVLDVLERHGYRQADDQHTGRSVGLIGDLARIYEGTQETPASVGSEPAAQQGQPGPDPHAPAVTSSTKAIVDAEMYTILSAVDEAADYKRERAECCADCADQSCGLCQHRLGAARAYETLTVRLVRAMDADPPQKPSPQPVADVAARPVQPQATADKEAGQ
jgi:hypothetical protein